MGLEPPAPAAPRWSARLAAAALAAVAAAALPYFLHLPLWPDAVFYDICARNILAGGAHYRDTFDTNLPGMVWCHAAVRAAFGDGPLPLRLTDLAVAGGVVALLATWPGVPAGRRGWLAVVLAGTYLITPEICHVQRDVWMTLPALAALRCRWGQLGRLAGGGRVAAAGFGEGLLWGAGVWVKPQLVVPAAAAWAAGAWVAAGRGAPARRQAADLAGLVAGGLAAGAAGVAVLAAGGSWPAFWDVLTGWAPGYVPADPAWRRVVPFLTDRLPWGLVHLAVVPAAALAVGFARRRDPADPAAAARALLAALYLGWVAQAVGLQRGYTYQFVPPVLLGVAVLAGSAAPGRAWFRAAAGLVLLTAAALWARDATRLPPWAECLTTWGDRDFDNRVAAAAPPPDWRNARDPAALDRVADFLRAAAPADGEVACYDSRTIRLYRDLDLRPSTRFVMMDLWVDVFPGRRAEIGAAVLASRQRFVVTDVGLGPDGPDGPSWAPGPGGPLSLPAGFPPEAARQFPWNLPIVFRAGRYAVHRVPGR